MKMAYLFQTPPYTNSNGAVCDSLGKTSLTSLAGNYWATEFLIFPLFLLKENAILPMTARADCACNTSFYVAKLLRNLCDFETIYFDKKLSNKNNYI